MKNSINAGNYNIYFGNDVFGSLSDFLNTDRYKNCKKFILTDEIVSEKWMDFLVEKIPEIDDAEMIQIESGEDSKVIEICMEIWKILIEQGADKKSLLINFGGGVVSDMGGFVAATFKRGIDFINIPTTLLSQVDASIGGKLGVDFLSYKNQIGLFGTPENVYIYPEFIQTLDYKQIISGFAEMIKHALISDYNYWKELKNTDIHNINSIQENIISSLHIKNNIVTLDPKENGIRKTLNFGHTIGHAIESYSLTNDEIYLMHGEAVAIGIICESYLSYKIAGLSLDELNEIVSFIKNIYPPYLLDTIASDSLITLMHQDKKNENSKINFTLLNKIGHANIDYTADDNLIRESLSYYSREISGKIGMN